MTPNRTPCRSTRLRTAAADVVTPVFFPSPFVGKNTPHVNFFVCVFSRVCVFSLGWSRTAKRSK